MSGEEVAEIIKEEFEEIIDALVDGLESAYDDLKDLIEEVEEDRDEVIDMIKGVLEIMKDAGRISAETYAEIIKRLGDL